MSDIDLSLIIVLSSAITAVWALGANIWATKENTKTRQLQLLENTFSSIQGAERLLYEKYKKSDPNAKKEWDSLFFNKLNFFAFLVTKKHIDNNLSKFFDDAIVDWYERIFMEYHKEDIDNPEIYPYLKELYESIKAKKESHN